MLVSKDIRTLSLPRHLARATSPPLRGRHGHDLAWPPQTTLHTLSGHRNAVHWLPSPVATASWDESVRLWDTATGKATAVLFGPTEKVLAVAFSPDGSLLAACSGKWAEKNMDADVPAPAEVIVWDLSGKKKRTLTPHNDRVFGWPSLPMAPWQPAGTGP